MTSCGIFPSGDFRSGSGTKATTFKALDNLRPTATGIDRLPAWFLRVGAPLFCRQITVLFNLSVATSAIPRQLVETGEH